MKTPISQVKKVPLETIHHGDASFTVSISELKNVNALGQDDLLAIAKKHSEGVLAFQLLDASIIAGDGHLLSATQNALNAFRGGYSIARSIAVEILLYASCQNQIGIALETLGVKDALSSIALVVVDPTRNHVLERVQSALSEIGPEVTFPFSASEDRIDRVLKHFEIKHDEILSIAESDTLAHRYDALTRCVVSRVSMVALDG